MQRDLVVVAGLGNPGRDYEDTRHNVGFLVVDVLQSRLKLPGWREKFGGAVTGSTTDGVMLFKPLRYMNLSGGPVGELLKFHKVKASELIVVHDELDLEFGTVRLKRGGGHGGHNGLRSLIEQVGADFIRVRCGIGRPPGGGEKRADVTDYVLGPFSRAQQSGLADLLTRSADAVDEVMQQGVVKAMNHVNRDG